MNQPSSLDNRPRPGAVNSERILAALALGLALVWIAWTALSWYRYHPHLPWRDLLPVLAQVRELCAAPFDLAAFWQWFEPHYSTHRIAVPRLLLLLDHSVLSGQNHSFYVAAWLCLLALVALYARLAAGYFGEARAVLFTAALACIWLFSPAHLWNLINPINVSWHVSLATSLLAFYLLLNPGSGPGHWHWLGAYALCAIAAFSTFAGVIAWLMLPVVALLIQARAFIPTLLASAACAWLYAGGMSSDAALAGNWDTGSQAVIAEIRAQAEAAMAANTPLRIMEKTLQFLTWPLTAQAPQVALVLSLGSLAVLGMCLVSALISATRAHEHVQPWFSFCLIAAGLCLGIALATQLGRLMVHPNHAHGPSYERYQTVVVIYWLSISGLLLSQKPRSGFGGAGLYAALLGLAWVLQVPAGAYLREEIQSAETAARLFDRGQLAHGAGLRPAPGNRFSPQYVYSFDAWLEQRALAYRAPMATPARLDQLEPCSTDAVTLNAGAAEGFTEYMAARRPRAISGSITPARAAMMRAIVLYQGGQVVGRLSPVHTGAYTPYALLRGEATHWQGMFAATGSSDLALVAHAVTGTRALCNYTLRAAP